jgi:putative ABC transport system substrate-binding protein
MRLARRASLVVVLLVLASVGIAWAEWVGSAAYAVPHREAWRMSARLVARILRGAKPQDLPVESADVFELHVNRAVEKERGVQIPESVLRRADKMFE